MRRIEGAHGQREIIGREEAIGIDVTKRAAQVTALLAESGAARCAECALAGRKRAGRPATPVRSKLRAGNKPVDAGHEAIVEFTLQTLPHGVTVGLDDHAAFDDFGRLRHVALQDDVLVPA